MACFKDFFFLFKTVLKGTIKRKEKSLWWLKCLWHWICKLTLNILYIFSYTLWNFTYSFTIFSLHSRNCRKQFWCNDAENCKLILQRNLVWTLISLVNWNAIKRPDAPGKASTWKHGNQSCVLTMFWFFRINEI